jgi:hypothetical protein
MLTTCVIWDGCLILLRKELSYVGGTLPEGEGVTTGVSAVDDSYVRGNCEHPPAPAPCGVESMSSSTKTETEISLVSVAALIIAIVFVKQQDENQCEADVLCLEIYEYGSLVRCVHHEYRLCQYIEALLIQPKDQ